MAKTIAIIGALDTKGEDFAFAKRRIQQRGFIPLLLDFGVLGEPAIAADIGRAEVATAAGERLADLVARHNRAHALARMTEGAAAHVLRLFGEARIHGILGMGGGGGTTVATGVMRRLPIGFPKLMVSTVAATNTQPYVGTSDIVMVPSVVDVAGLNRISRIIYTRAVDALCGMVDGVSAGDAERVADRKLVAATMFGVTTPCVSHARALLEQRGVETLIFHANGGGRAMERLIDDGFFDGVLDLTLTEWADELVGGVRSAGPERLDAVARSWVPQVVSIGALDMVNFGPRSTVPARFERRLFHEHNAATTLMRTTPEESAELGRIIAAKLNRAKGSVVLLLPLLGMSALDSVGEVFDDQAARNALYDTLRTQIDPQKIVVREVAAHINDLAFAEIAVDTILALMAAHPKPGHQAV